MSLNRAEQVGDDGSIRGGVFKCSVGRRGPCRGLNWRGMAGTGSSLGVSTGDSEDVIPSR